MLTSAIGGIACTLLLSLLPPVFAFGQGASLHPIRSAAPLSPMASFVPVGHGNTLSINVFCQEDWLSQRVLYDSEILAGDFGDRRSVAHPLAPSWATVSADDLVVCPNRQLVVEGSGWPMIAMTLRGTSCAFGSPIQITSGVPFGANRTIRIGNHYTRSRVVPLHVVWLGFVVNSAVWGALTLGGTFIIRRWRCLSRQRRHACASCGYDLGHHTTSICPECGRPVRGRVDKDGIAVGQ